jgi:adenylate cyclase
MGDGWIVEFSGVSDAVDCAIKIQEGLKSHELIRLRIGVHIGEVVFEEEDVFGDGVNVAARLEAIANPGGVVISDTAYNSLDGKSAKQFGDGETQKLKNIARPVGIWRWPVLQGKAIDRQAPATEDRKPTLHVRGFSGREGSDDEFISSGINDALVVSLSSLTGHNYVVDEEDADYVVFGVVQSLGNRCRVTAQMLDRRNNRQVWAEKYDTDAVDAFEFQDACVYRISMSVRAKVFALEGERLHGRDIQQMTTEEILSYAGSRFWIPEVSAWKSVLPLMEEVLRRNPDNFMAMGMAATTYIGELIYGYRKTEPSDIKRAGNWIDQARRINPNSDFINIARAQHLAVFGGSIDEAEMAAKRSLELNPNYNIGYHTLGFVQVLAGNYEAGLANEYRAIEADKRNPYLHMFHYVAGLAYFALRDYVSAGKQFVLSDQLRPELPATLMAYASASWHEGDRDQARSLIGHLLRLEPEIRIPLVHFPVFRENEVLERYVLGLREAGLPE